MKEIVDIHRREQTLATSKALVAACGVSARSKASKPISKRNVELILAYERVRAFEGLKPSSRNEIVTRLLYFARTLDKDFDKATKEDFKNTVERCNKEYALWTACKIRMIFRLFYKWLKYGDDYTYKQGYPEEVMWIKKGLKKNNMPHISRNDCWTEEEIKKLLSVLTNPRDKALLCILTETGARIGEVGNLRIGDIYQDDFGYLIHLDGKTGEREDRVIYSSPAIAEWLNCHPRRDDPNAPLFCNSHNHTTMAYNSIYCLVTRRIRKAGLSHKKCNPHIFRHSRATLLIEQGWPEPIIKQYLGWEPDSKMLGVYGHIKSRQANQYMLKAHGLAKNEVCEPKLVEQLCSVCHEKNGPEANFCKKCGRPLHHKAMLKYNDYKNKAYKILQKIMDNPNATPMLKKLLDENTGKPEEQT